MIAAWLAKMFPPLDLWKERASPRLDLTLLSWRNPEDLKTEAQQRGESMMWFLTTSSASSSEIADGSLSKAESTGARMVMRPSARAVSILACFTNEANLGCSASRVYITSPLGGVNTLWFEYYRGECRLWSLPVNSVNISTTNLVVTVNHSGALNHAKSLTMTKVFVKIQSQITSTHCFQVLVILKVTRSMARSGYMMKQNISKLLLVLDQLLHDSLRNFRNGSLRRCKECEIVEVLECVFETSLFQQIQKFVWTFCLQMFNDTLDWWLNDNILCMSIMLTR